MLRFHQLYHFSFPVFVHFFALKTTQYTTNRNPNPNFNPNSNPNPNFNSNPNPNLNPNSNPNPNPNPNCKTYRVNPVTIILACSPNPNPITLTLSNFVKKMPKPPEKHRKSSSRSSLKDKDGGSIADKAAKQDKEKVCTSSSRKREHHEKKPLVVKNKPNDDENSCERLCYLSPETLEFDKTGLPFKYYENEKAECGGGVDIEEFVRLWKDYNKNGEVSEVATSMSTRGGRKDAAMEKEEGLESEGLSLSQVLEKMRHILETKGHLGLNEFEKLLKKTEEEPVLHRLEMFGDGNSLPPYAGQGIRCVQPPKEMKRGEVVVNKEVQQQPRTEYDDYIAMNNGEPLTHYNETTGVPLQRRSVAGEVSLGHTVVTLHEAFNLRITRLQALVSTYLMPNRERLLQIRKRFLADSEEVSKH